MIDLTFTIAGQAGQGMQSISSTLGRMFARAGLHVFASQDLMSRIRGGHNFSSIRASDLPVSAPSNKVNLLIALDEPSVNRHLTDMVPGGVVIFDGEGDAASGPAELDKPFRFPVPMTRFAKSIGKNPVMTNAVALGAVMFLTDYPFEQLKAMFQDTFAAKGGQVVQANIACAHAGFDYAAQHFKGACPCKLTLAPDPRPLTPDPRPLTPDPLLPRLLLTGNEAIALGAICSGVKFHSGYPMSPSTTIMEFLAAHGKEFGIIVEQTEDEIGGINMALGASYAGVRAMTATSGGGFALMVEGLGLSGISETPIVIVICSRPGPATGFPTRTEQADLLFALHAGQDEFPRFIFAPGTAEQAFYLTNKAFDLSQKYQVPAIVLSDQLLSDSATTVDDFDLSRLANKDHAQQFREQDRSPYTYERYAATGDAYASLLPGSPNQIVVAAGHEHTDAGYITESASDRIRMMDRRQGKLKPMREELDGMTEYPQSAAPRTPTPDTLLVCFGSTFGAVREATDILRTQGTNVGLLHLSELAPFPDRLLTERAARSRRLITVEGNATAQLARLIHAETRLHIADSILKYDGRPFTAGEVVREVTGSL
jgi:2-oxoglutarate ferredoxin oxidoreductase subunit alpha